MSAELVSILALVIMFVIGTVLPINLGALALTGAFLVGTLVAGMSEDDIVGAFPGGLFVILVGVTYLFAIATNNGTVDWLVRASVRAVRGRIVAIPVVMFLLAALFTAIGAPAPAVAAILAPIAFGFAAEYGINAMLIGVLVAHGTNAGAFSPISVLGGIVNGVLDKARLPGNDVALFAGSFLFNLAAAAIAFVAFGGLALLHRRHTRPPGTEPDDGGDETADDTADLRLTPHQILTLAGIVGLCVATLAFDLDVGLVAITVAVVLAITSPDAHRGAVEKIAWPTVLLIGGVVTYVGVLEEMGTIDYVGDAVAGIGAPLLAALLICYVGAVVSAFASTVGILGALIPLAVPFLLSGEIGVAGVVAALAISSAIVDVSPFSTTGALLVANVRGMERDLFYRKLLRYGAAVTLVAPPAAWLVLVAPGWLG
ncbi:SLC13 family permease [Actinomadura rugatobispora]|uniref:SLC13 family permease n=1 Tax=Actinomadura rugatobispora TaxID=1994 RepID=A0ABW1A2I4_9ACTN|nr:SLC13 family permease [Actinomadura rugatobispora]